VIPIVEILRIEDSFEFGVFGIMRIQKEFFCCTLEPPEFENIKNVSCIPTGQYMCWRINSAKAGGATFEVRDVPGRDRILFHKGNFVGDTKGCILLVQYFGKIGKNRAGLNSGTTFGRFMNTMLNRDAFHLTISEHY